MISGLLVVVVELLLLVAASTVAITTPQPVVAIAASSAAPSPGPIETSNHQTGPQMPQTATSGNATTLSLNQTSSSSSYHDLRYATSLAAGENSDLNRKEKGKASKWQSQPPIYTNQFVIEVKGGEEEARKLAHKHGFVYLNHILGDFYHLEHKRLSKRSLSLEDADLDISIQDEPQVLLLERQVLKRRVKRDFLELPDWQQQPPAAFGRAQQQNQHQQNQQHRTPGNQRPVQVLRPPGRPQHHQFTRPANQLPNYGARAFAQQPKLGPLKAANSQQLLLPLQPDEGQGRAAQELLEAAGSSSAGQLVYQQQQQQVVAPAPPPARRPSLNLTASPSQQITTTTTTAINNQSLPDRPFNDPSWPLMWYLDGGAKNGFDLNVLAAWKMGYTGKGIVITILDDGLEKDHPDLQANYDPLASFDINGDDADPMPRYDANDSNRHGTRCAGEVAAVPDNNICSIGIAYNSKVGGVRMLDGDVTDAVEARSLGLNNQHIHIYSASWGPDDNGKTVDGPGDLATRAFMEGVTNGRQGLGSIFVFASGNGGREHDNCNCDGYTNSIWTLSISSATENGYVPWYIEACSSTLATTYSSGSYEERQIATTDLHHTCTSSHTGTSASAPLAAGICALVLESNPRLTWRDMQHIVVKTAKPANLIAKDWRTNALGRNVSHAFGYGLMDAAAMIIMAKKWTTVPKQFTCEVRSPQMDLLIRPKGYVELKLRAECANVRFLEHVQSKVTLTAARRGDLHIYLVSPHGTRSTLLAQRPNDLAEQGFRNWPFMTVHSWGESPNGNWTLEVHNDGKPQNRAFLKEMTLILYGTYDDPNRHLVDGTIAAPPARPSPPPHAGSQKPQTGSVKPAPPAPMPPFVEPPLELPTRVEPKPVNQQDQGRPAWVINPLPPPVQSRPVQPVTTPQPISSTSSSRTSTSSTSSSYVSTFKTIVSTGRPPAAKADFEIVSAQGVAPDRNPQRPEPTLGDMASSTTTTTPTPHLTGAANSRPTAFAGIHEGPPMKPPVSSSASLPEVSNHNYNQTQADNNSRPLKEEPTTQSTGSVELEGNQIDLKLSKDYRSSGDHYSTAGDRLLSPPDLSAATSTNAASTSSSSSSQGVGKGAPAEVASSAAALLPNQLLGLLLLLVSRNSLFWRQRNVVFIR